MIVFRGTDTYDSSEKNRIPAWCDRILFRSDHTSKVKNLSYQRHEVTISDHRPVSGLFEVKLKSVIPDKLDRVKLEVTRQWQEVEEKELEQARRFYHSLV
jgi:hypothetical protein